MDRTVWERRDCVSAEVEDALVLLELDSLVYHALNTTAAAVWQLLAEPQSAEGLSVALQARYAVEPEQCRSAVDRLLSQMAAKGLIRPQSDSPANTPAPIHA